MNEEDLETLLWEVGRVAPEETTEPPSDQELERYRSGDLDEAAAEALERRLGASPEGQARLMALGGFVDQDPPASVRRKILQRFATREVDVTPARRVRTWWASAALAAGLLLAILIPSLRQDHVPPGLAYDIAVQGNAWVRSGDDLVDGQQAGIVEVDADTEIRIAATPREGAVGGLEVGLYRQVDSQLARLSPAEGLRTETLRGGALFRGRAGDLLGATPDVYRLLLTVANAGDLPSEVAVESGESLEAALASEGRRLVFPIVLQLLAGSQTTEPADRPEGFEP